MQDWCPLALFIGAPRPVDRNGDRNPDLRCDRLCQVFCKISNIRRLTRCSLNTVYCEIFMLALGCHAQLRLSTYLLDLS